MLLGLKSVLCAMNAGIVDGRAGDGDGDGNGEAGTKPTGEGMAETGAAALAGGDAADARKCGVATLLDLGGGGASATVGGGGAGKGMPPTAAAAYVAVIGLGRYV